MLPETSVVETVAASHVIGVLLSECVEWGAIGMARFNPDDRGANCSKYSKWKRHASLPVQTYFPGGKLSQIANKKKERPAVQLVPALIFKSNLALLTSFYWFGRRDETRSFAGD
jgi:hypothetical protein